MSLATYLDEIYDRIIKRRVINLLPPVESRVSQFVPPSKIGRCVPPRYQDRPDDWNFIGTPRGK